MSDTRKHLTPKGEAITKAVQDGYEEASFSQGWNAAHEERYQELAAFTHSDGDTPYTRPRREWWWLEWKIREQRKVISRLEQELTNAKQQSILTKLREPESVEAVASSLFEHEKATMGEAWYHPSETFRGLGGTASSPWKASAQAAINAIETIINT